MLHGTIAGGTLTKRLIVAPHADDEALGCGGLIAKYPDECSVVVLSDKDDGRLDEFFRAQKTLGYKSTTICPFKTGELAARSREVTTMLDSVISDLRPDVLYIPTPGAHQDHIAAYEAGIRAARLSYTDSAWFVPTVLLYEVPSYATDLYTIPYPWSRYEFLTEEQMDLKVAAINEYGSQTNGAFSPGDMARAHATYIGAKCGNGYAEQYAVVREIVGY